ncbi:hypothetical protein CANARDRAFT_69088 [[Candida] arabinofermentans NRRL YB-2248]|uniref:Glutaredoxin domain-containing protein n=1 Tax=[Candida] arabinofermentans NRRL YB-2248 TaxID=983967 RepID=A0A1E4SXH6_9ASCO|nr:hypothetical protein CANARDRAFT_69088 [[Candida] arabinofermentans NRRL YB-2248]
MNFISVLLTLLIIYKLSSVLRRFFGSSLPVREMSKETVAKVNSIINSHPVFVASKTYCPYCSSAKKTLEAADADAYVLELNTLEDGDEIQDALYSITGQRTVPSIFIGGKHIGGNSDLQALGKSALAAKLKEAK